MPIRKTEHQDKLGNWEIFYTQEHGCNDMLRLVYKDHTAGGGRQLPQLMTNTSPTQLRKLAKLVNLMADEIDPPATFDMFDEVLEEKA